MVQCVHALVVEVWYSTTRVLDTWL